MSEQVPSQAAPTALALREGLRRLAKAVVVITHDDRYFDAADRVVHLQDGRVVEEDDSDVRTVLEA